MDKIEKSLEQEIENWIPAHISIRTDETLSVNPTEIAETCKEWGKCIAHHFAEWGAEHLRDSTMMDKSLEEAAETHVKNKYCLTKLLGAEIREAVNDFIAGAEWQKSQMLKDAINGWLDEDNEPPYDLNVICEEKIPFGKFKHDDKVRIIVLKAEEEE